ncbi:hypothetical protein QFZ60_001573 [Arthrobacter sp. B2I5]|uniref:hypothetical protein n=1 Tax=Arthrobacter sp. B2I5 TaxID=3042266 RepID=UPI002780F942|nr:hypothetical protein [Arthrobacter sp. B2I5]MDQ0825400.1 hypothetical protein [Arthrobacter sp. B2I5]
MTAGKSLAITISESTLAFLQRTARELETQNNRHTATPVFRIYEEIKVEKRDGCGDHLERLDYEGAEDHYCSHCKDLLGEEMDFDKLPSIGEDGCDCNYIDEAHWTFDVELLPAQGGYDGVAFLTEKAAQEYLESNSYHFDKGVVYAESAFRNHELNALIEAIKEIGEVSA